MPAPQLDAIRGQSSPSLRSLRSRAPNPIVADASLPLPVAMLAAAAREVPAVVAAFMPKKAGRLPVAMPRRVAAVRPRVGIRATRSSSSAPTARRSGVDVAWNTLTQRYPALRAYLPLRARFDSPKGTFWRLSIQGFDNQREAIARCQHAEEPRRALLRPHFAGDAPVQIASR